MLEKYVVLDFETSGLNFYEPDFEVISASLTSYTGESKFYLGKDQVRSCLETLHESQIPVLVYNLGFELGVTRCLFPDLKINYSSDVQRLVQVFDNGGFGALQGFKLDRAGKRILKIEGEGHKTAAHDWIRTNVPECRRGKEGGFINRLPPDLLEAYNVADTEITRDLFEFIVKHFEEVQYDWTVDHSLYMFSVGLIVDSKIRGIRVDRDHLLAGIESLTAEVNEIDRKFCQMFDKEISLIREELRVKAQAKFKKKILTEAPPFNITSKKQLSALFCTKLGLDIGFQTTKGSPSFKATHMALYGEGGKLLEKRGKKLLHISQCKALLNLSELDSKWHPGLRVVGTRSGRFAGGN